MPEYRQNPLTGNWVIMAPGRGRRPQELARSEAPARPAEDRVAGCPFCPGNERQATPEVYAVRDDYGTVDREGWHVRVVPNKFPAVAIDADAELPAGESPLRAARPGVGMHEVIIESPSHSGHFALHDDAQATRIIETLRHRCRMIMQARDIKYVCPVKNHGRSSGGSIRHPHIQILATAVVPPMIGRMVDRLETFARENGRGLFEVMQEQEQSAGRRVIARDDAFVTLAPWASQAPYEMWIVPTAPASSFGDLQDSQTKTLALTLREALRRLYHLLNDPDYNFIIHTSPRGQRAQEHFRWFVQIMPRVITHAGFEAATGMYINHVPPEEAAAALRDVSTP